MFWGMSTFFEFVNFLEENNRYMVELFSVNLIFNGLSNDISHFVLAETFIISAYLKYVDIYTDFVDFLEEYSRYKVEFFRVNSNFKGLSKDISFINVA